MTTTAQETWVPRFELCDRLRRIRRDRGMSQAEFAALLDVRDRTYSAWESGKNTPSGSQMIATAKRIELAVGVPAWWTLGLGAPGPTPDTPNEWAPRDSNPQPTDYKGAVIALFPDANAA